MQKFVCGVFLTGLSLVLAADYLRAGGDKTEAGYTPLFNGKDLTGWKAKKGNEPLDGKTEAYKGRFKVQDGQIVIDFQVKGDSYIYTTKEFPKDVTIKIDFNPTFAADNTSCNNDILFHGSKFDIVKTLKGVKDKEWNELEITVKGGKASFKVNGVEQKAAANKGATNNLTLRAEFGTIKYKNIRAKE